MSDFYGYNENGQLNQNYHEDLLLMQMQEEQQMEEEQQQNAQTPEEAVANELSAVDAEQAQEWVAGNCSYFTYTVASPPKSRSIPQREMQAVAAQANADPKAVNTSLKIFDPKEFPTIKEGENLKRKFESLVLRYAVPKHVLVRSIVQNNSGSQEVVVDEKDKGRFMILNAHIEEFMEKFNQIKSEYMVWADRFLTRYDAIMRRDQERLAGFWPLIQHKYPTKQYVEHSLRVRTPVFEAASAVMSTGHLPSTMRDSIAAQCREEASSQIMSCCNIMTEAMLGAVTLASKQLGNRVRVWPNAADEEYGRFREAELILKQTHEDDNSILPGNVRLKLQLVTTDENGKRVNRKDNRNQAMTEVIDISEADYHEKLRPQEMNNEHCRLYDKQIQDLMDLGDKFNKFKGMLAVGQSPLKSFSDEVNAILEKHGASSSSIVQRLKKNPSARSGVQSALNDMKSKLAEELVVQKKRKKVSRRNLNL